VIERWAAEAVARYGDDRVVVTRSEEVVVVNYE
jgi:hypothetical protein